MKFSIPLRQSAVFATVMSGFALPAHAHHGFGLFQLDIKREWSGTITKMNLVNPHSYMEIDAIDENGQSVQLRCEMRAASLLRRSGWDTDVLRPGTPVAVTGCAGFIGSTVTEALLEMGCVVTGVDCLTDYYDVGLKMENMAGFADHEAQSEKEDQPEDGQDARRKDTSERSQRSLCAAERSHHGSADRAEETESKGVTTTS